MRILLAGASGVVGRPLLPRLVGEGHEVTGLTRRPERAKTIRASGADAVVCDVLDREQIRTVAVASRPEIVIQHLTDLPPNLNPRNMKRAYDANDRLRSAGSANLLAAAVAAGSRRYIAQNVCFAYAPIGGTVKDESAPLFTDAPPPFDRSARVYQEMETRITEAPGLESLVLRFGFWYGPGTSYDTDGYLAREVRRRRFPIIGGGGGIFSFVHIDDVVEATMRALEHGGGRCLQRMRRRAGAGPRMAPGLCRGAGGKVALEGAALACAAVRRLVCNADDDRAQGRVKCEGQAGAQLAAPIPQLADRIRYGFAR